MSHMLSSTSTSILSTEDGYRGARATGHVHGCWCSQRAERSSCSSQGVPGHWRNLGKADIQNAFHCLYLHVQMWENPYKSVWFWGFRVVFGENLIIECSFTSFKQIPLDSIWPDSWHATEKTVFSNIAADTDILLLWVMISDWDLNQGLIPLVAILVTFSLVENEPAFLHVQKLNILHEYLFKHCIIKVYRQYWTETDLYVCHKGKWELSYS